MFQYDSSFSIPPEEPSKHGIKRLHKLFAWIPPTWLEQAVTFLVTPALTWVVIYLMAGEEALPGGPIFALLVILFGGLAAGSVMEFLRLPPLLGMLSVGLVMRNFPRLNYGEGMTDDISYPVRLMALGVVLNRAGLCLDPAALRKIKWVVLRLTLTPCLTEATTVAISSHFILGFTWPWGFVLGFAVASVGPAVVIPAMLSLRDKGYGVEKRIPTLLMAASGGVDILAISAFGISLGFAVSQNRSLVMLILQGPLQILLGVSYGIVWGLVMGLMFANLEKGPRESIACRILFTLGGGFLSIFGFNFIKFGQGGLGCMTSTFVSAIIWRRRGVLHNNDNMTWFFHQLWLIFQPLLFGLIGFEIEFRLLDTRIIELGILCLCIGFTFRVMITFLVISGAGFNIKEKLFIALAWTPKATVQAVLGPIAFDLVRELKPGPERDLAEQRGLEVLTIAVLAILLGAPLGSIAIKIGGPRLLTKNIIVEDDDDEDRKTQTTYSNTLTLQSTQPDILEMRLNIQQQPANEVVLLKIASLASALKIPTNKPAEGDANVKT